MDFTETEKQILYNAWALHLKGAGQVVEDWAVPDAHRLAEAGWLDRKLEQNGDISWWWTPRAEGALRLSELVDEPSRN
jgi:hypothetical protein